MLIEQELLFSAGLFDSKSFKEILFVEQLFIIEQNVGLIY